MKKALTAIFLTLAGSLAHCIAAEQPFPAIPDARLRVLKYSEVLPLNPMTFPIFFQRRAQPEKELNLPLYFESIDRPLIPEAIAPHLERLARGDEFEKRDAKVALTSWHSQMSNWASSAKHVLVPAIVSLGTYDFDTKSFPVTVALTDWITLKGQKGSVRAFCGGRMWSIPKSGYRGQTPCVYYPEQPLNLTGAFPRIPIEDEAAAREMRKSGGHAFVLTRFNNYAVEEGRMSTGDVPRALQGEALALYVFNFQGDFVTLLQPQRMAREVPAVRAMQTRTPKPQKGATRAAPRARRQTGQLTPVEATAATSSDSASQAKPVATISID